MFALDRDLLALEPNLFRDAAWAGQRVVSGVGDVAGETLTLLTQDVDFEGAGVGAGHVVVVSETVYEVVERLSATEARVSRLRPGRGGAVVAPTPVTNKGVAVVTFGPQIAVVHAQVLRLLGLGGDGPAEEAVTNPEDLVALEALGTLHLVYAAAAALAQRDSGLRARAEYYEERFMRERQGVGARVDLNGDGVPDAVRRPSLLYLYRG